MGDDRNDDAPRWLPPTPGEPDAATRSQPPAPAESNGKATTSLVLGILGLLLCPWVLSTLAVVFGRKARLEIDRSGGRYGNRGVATAGVVLGWIGLAYAVFITIYLIDGLDTPDNDDNGVPDGIEDGGLFALLVLAGVRVIGAAL